MDRNPRLATPGIAARREDVDIQPALNQLLAQVVASPAGIGG
jgi:hypothetical protein